MASNWWLFIGTALCCSGFLLPIGIIILVWWFIDYIFNRDTPLVRTGNSNDIAGPAFFLCSKDSDYITGQILLVDGGISSIF